MSGDVIVDDEEVIEDAIDHDRAVSGDVTDDTNHADDCENPDLKYAVQVRDVSVRVSVPNMWWGNS